MVPVSTRLHVCMVFTMGYRVYNVHSVLAFHFTPSWLLSATWPLQATIESKEDPAFRLSDGDDVGQGQVYGTPMPRDKPINPEFSSGPCKKRPG